MQSPPPLGTDPLSIDPDTDDGTAVLSSLLDLGRRSIARLMTDGHAMAATTRLRGTGPGVSFRQMVASLEARHPVELRYPFEANPRVGGAIWPGTLVDSASEQALMKLRWEAGADDLPIHTHEHSDRCIIVLKGRGFFHISDDDVMSFAGNGVKTVAARERDVFVFRRGALHTFSTYDSAMELLSCHVPFIPLDDLRQYTLPDYRWMAREHFGCLKKAPIELHGWSLVLAGS